jgi:hypothetical protein
MFKLFLSCCGLWTVTVREGRELQNSTNTHEVENDASYITRNL